MRQSWTGRARDRAALALVIAASSLALTGCGSPAVLANALRSDDALATAVLEAVARSDQEALRALALTADEFERVVWPQLPASRPEVGLTSGYLWEDTDAKSRAHLSGMLRQWGGRRLQLVRVEFGGPTTAHGGYSVSRKTRLVVRDEAGEERAVRLFGSIIRQHGGSKVYSFVVD